VKALNRKQTRKAVTALLARALGADSLRGFALRVQTTARGLRSFDDEWAGDEVGFAQGVSLFSFVNSEMHVAAAKRGFGPCADTELIDVFVLHYEGTRVSLEGCRVFGRSDLVADGDGVVGKREAK